MTPEEQRKAYEAVAAKRAILLDVRTEWEREEEGFESQSLHMDYERFTYGELPELPKDTVIYVHCKSGGRAGIVVQVLQAHGFKNVSNFGGLDDWMALKQS